MLLQNILKKGATVVSNFEPVVSFETLSDINFGSAAGRILKSAGGVTTVTVRGVSAVAGITKIFKYNAVDAVKFL